MSKSKDKKGFSMTLPWKGKPKARPRVTSNGTFMPKLYTEWKEAIAEYVKLDPKSTELEGPLSLVVEFRPKEIMFLISESDTDRHGQGDIDNLLGGLMDALEDAGVYKNDSQVQRVLVEIRR